MSLNRLELEIIGTVANAHDAVLAKQIPFLSIRAREMTGAGCYVYLDCDPSAPKCSRDGEFDGGGCMIECEGTKYGLGFTLTVESGFARMIEIATYGNVSWDGDISKCRIV